MTDTTTMQTTPPAAPAAPAPAAAPVSDLDALRAQIAELQAAVKANATVPPVSPETHGPIKLVGMAAVSAWFKGVRATVMAWDGMKWVWDILQGLKTLLLFSVTGALALLTEFETIDLTPLLNKVLPEGAHIDAAGAVVIMSVVAVLLRLVTKTSIFRKAQGTIAGATDSKVDVPEGG